MEEKYKAYLELKESSFFWKNLKRKYLIVVLPLFILFASYIVKKADDLRAVLGYLVIVFFSLIVFYVFLLLVAFSKRGWIRNLLSNDKKFIEYVAKRDAERLSENLDIFLREKERGKRSSISPFELDELKESLKELKNHEASK